eukprot:g13004.t1
MDLVGGYGSSSSDDDEPKEQQPQPQQSAPIEPPKGKGKAPALPAAARARQASINNQQQQQQPIAEDTGKNKRKSSSGSGSGSSKKKKEKKKKKKKSKTVINALVLSPEIQAALARGETLGDSDSDDDAPDKKPPKIVRRPAGSDPNDLLSLLPQPSTAASADDILLKNRKKRQDAKTAKSDAAAAAAPPAAAAAPAPAGDGKTAGDRKEPDKEEEEEKKEEKEEEEGESDSDDDDGDDLLAGMRAKSAAAAGGSDFGAAPRSSPLFTLPSRSRQPPGPVAADPPPPEEETGVAGAVPPIVGDDTPALAATGYSEQQGAHGRQWGATQNGHPLSSPQGGGYGGAGYSSGAEAGLGAQYGIYGTASVQHQAPYYQPPAPQAAAGFGGGMQQGASAHEAAEFGGGGGKATRRKGRDMERALARGDLGALGSETPVMDLHQGSNEYNPLRSKPVTAAMKQEQKHIESSVYDPRTGKTVKTLEPTSMQKRKHQINQLAVQAASMERDLMERSGASRLTKAQTHANLPGSGINSTHSVPTCGAPTAPPPVYLGQHLVVSPSVGPKKKSKAQKEAERLQAEEEERKAEILRVRREAERVRKEAEDAKRLKEEQIAERTEELERLANELQGAQDQVPELDQAMERCVYGESIAADLLNGMGEALENGDTSRVSRNQEFLELLRGLTSDKIDFATAHLLSHWDSLSGGDEEFDRTCMTAGCIRFGVWVNVSLKGFRMKTVDFAAAGMATDVPRPLSGASVAVRNVFVPYRFVRNNKSGGSGSGSGNSNGGVGAAAGAEAVGDGGGDTRGGEATVSAGGAAQKDDKIVLGGTFCLDILALPPGIKKIKGWVFRAETELSKTVARQTYPLDGGNAALAPALRVQFEIPDGVIVPTTPEVRRGERVRCWDSDLSCWTSEGIDEAEWQSAKRVVRLHTTRVGSIAIVQDRARDLSYLGWRLTPIYDPDPLSEGVEGIEDGDALPQEQVPEAELQLETPRFLVRIRIRGTKCRLLGPDLPELRGLLDASGMGAGRLIMELERAGKDENKEHFRRMEKGGICLSPRDEDAARAAPVVGLDGVVISGTGGEGGQAGDASDGEGQDANRNKSGVVLKDRTLEETLCREVASVAAAFEMRSSKWNGSIGEGRAVFEVSDSAHNAPDVGTAPCPVKCALVNGNGIGRRGADGGNDARGVGVAGTGGGVATMDTTRLPAEETHAYLIKSLAMSSCAEATERAQQSCCRFQKAVEQLLRITRPFSFS